jgi:hypothetical protein
LPPITPLLTERSESEDGGNDGRWTLPSVDELLPLYPDEEVGSLEAKLLPLVAPVEPMVSLYWLPRLPEFRPGPLIPEVPWRDSLSAPLERPDVETFW